MGGVRNIGDSSGYSPEYRATATPAADFPALKATLAERRMAPADWAAQLRAMMSHDVGRANGGSLDRAASRVTAKALVVVAAQDHMVNPLPALEFAPKIHARVVELTGNCGHMATSCEAAKLGPAVKAFLGE